MAIVTLKPPYIKTLPHVVAGVKSLTFPRLDTTLDGLKLARELVPIPALLKYVGLSSKRNQRCWFCPIDAHTTETSLCVFRHTHDGHWMIHVDRCTTSADVSDIWERIVAIVRGWPHKYWDKYAAGADLVARAGNGEFDLEAELEGSRDGVYYYDGTYNGDIEWDWPKRKRRVDPYNTWVHDNYSILRQSVKHVHVIPPKAEPLPRTRRGLLQRRYICVEADRWTLEQPYWIHRQLSEYLRLDCLCFSGGKSLHGFYHCQGLFESDLLDFYAQALADVTKWSTFWVIMSTAAGFGTRQAMPSAIVFAAAETGSRA